jgi:hypothetical protein
MSSEEMYELDAQDHKSIEEAAEWFLGTRKPRTAPEVRGVLVKLYLAGLLRGIGLTKEVINEA